MHHGEKRSCQRKNTSASDRSKYFSNILRGAVMNKIRIQNLLFLILALFSFDTLAKDPTKTVSISTKENQLLFDKESLSAKPNQTIKLTFKNTESKTSGLQHNWVLVKPGTAEEVSSASISAGPAKGWLAESPAILAHTKLLNAGESETLTFRASSTPGD